MIDISSGDSGLSVKSSKCIDNVFSSLIEGRGGTINIKEQII